MAIDDAARASYEKRVASLIRKGDKVQLKDLLRIKSRFSAFSRSAIASIQSNQGFALTRAIQQSTLLAIAQNIDELGDDLSRVFSSGFGAQSDLARQLRVAFGDSFLPDQLEQVLGISQTARAVAAATNFSADLIDGITDRMRREINGIVGRAALGVAGQTAFDSVTEIQRALRGDSLRRWRHHAERIYRTETLRVHSILTDQNIRDFNTRIPTDKRWAWSGISRREHSSINGQIARGNTGRFLVPIKEGGSVRLRFPRDPGGPPSAVINCGCYLVPVPREGAKPRGEGATARARRKPRLRKPKVTKPLTPAQRVTAAKRVLIDDLKVAREIQLSGIAGIKAAEGLESIAGEVRRLRKLFPMFKPKPLNRLILTRDQRGGVYHGGKGSLQVSNTNYSKTFLVNPDTGVLEAANFSGLGDEGLTAVFRHEFGHYIDDLRNINSGPAGQLWDEWRALTRKYPTRAKTSSGAYDRTPGESYPGAAKSWWTKNIDSQYASRWYTRGGRSVRGLAWTGDVGVEGGIEAWAELVAWVTKQGYVRGSLPADLESFVFKVLGG